MAVSKKTKALYNAVFDGFELCAANTIQKVQERRLLKKYAPKEPVPLEYAKAYKKFWGKYGNYSPLWGWYYASRNGNMDVRYVPHTLYYTKIDQHFNRRKLGWGFNDKNYYSKIFAGIKQPETVIRIFGGYFLDADYRQLTYKQAMKLILQNDEVICKPSQESGSGRSIQFWNTQKQSGEIQNFLETAKDASIVQRVLNQHSELDLVHRGSINSLRICSILMKDGVHILSSCLRMGVDKARIDNVTAGGISVGILSDGAMDEFAYNYFTGERTDIHPQGFVFKGHKGPSYDRAVELVMEAHPVIPNFRLVSWDIAIDDVGDPVLIEANMRKGGINLNQFSNGPLFGELTEQVLDEVFGKK